MVRKLVERFHLKAGLLAADGTVIEAAVSRWGMLQLDALRSQEQEARAAAAQQPQDAALQARAEKLSKAREIAEQRGEQRSARGRSAEAVRVSPCAPQAVFQPRKDKVNRPSYKPSVLVHESGLIVGQAAHASSETAVVGDLLDQHVQAFGSQPVTTLLDAGYCSNEVLRMMCERDIDVLCGSGKVINGEWSKQEGGAKLGKRRFLYEPSSDTYRCPAGEQLQREYEARDRHGRPYVRYRAAAGVCQRCSLRAQCTGSTQGRTLKRYADEEYREAAERVLEQAAARARYRKRMPLAERPMAEIRERLKFTRFRRVGTSGAAVEFSLCVLALNLKWAVGRGYDGVIGGRAVIFALCVARRRGCGGWELIGAGFLAIVI